MRNNKTPNTTTTNPTHQQHASKGKRKRQSRADGPTKPPMKDPAASNWAPTTTAPQWLRNKALMQGNITSYQEADKLRLQLAEALDTEQRIRQPSSNTDPPVSVCTYAEAATQVAVPAAAAVPPPSPLNSKGKEPAKATAPPNPPNPKKPTTLIQTVDNQKAQIQGIRWLVQEERMVGKLASSLVIYLVKDIDITHGEENLPHHTLQQLE
ncbi:hypothetical protein EV426DRAFT_706324 [Tirmania nivea]|nr:hypothetical protein EV426DRAFT_706324 [Tirmania nivea]